MEELDQILESLEHARKPVVNIPTKASLKTQTSNNYIDAMHKLVNLSANPSRPPNLASDDSSSSNFDMTELNDLLDDLYHAKVNLSHQRDGSPNLVIKPSSTSSSSSSPISSTSSSSKTTTALSSIRFSGRNSQLSNEDKTQPTSSSVSPPNLVMFRSNGGNTPITSFYDESLGRSSGIVNDSPSSSSSASLGSCVRPISERVNNTKQFTNTTDATRELEDLMNSLTMYKKNDRASQDTSRNSTETPSITNKNTNNNYASSNRSSAEISSRKTLLEISGKSFCSACNQPITGQVITALGKLWHPEHFRCHHCECVIGTSVFYEKENRPYCERDYLDLFSPKCAQCSCSILDKMLTALDKPWHIECFACHSCKKTLNDESFLEIDNVAYCKQCYESKLAPKCKKCQGSIVDHFISALDAYWHPSCFVCQECGSPFNSSSFFEYNSLPYCELHYHLKRGSLCASCQEPINGRCVMAMNKKFHPEHFVCSFCQRHLNKGTFKEQNDKPFCHGCFQKLFP